MKKTLCVIIGVITAILLCGCISLNDKPTKETGQQTQSEKTVKDDEFGIGDTAVFKNIKITATNIEEQMGSEFFQPEDGNIFVGIDFEIENISDETQSISSILLFDAYADDVKCNYSVSANVVFGNSSLDGELAAGKKMVGTYALEVPKDWEKIDLEIASEWLSNSKAKFLFKK